MDSQPLSSFGISKFNICFLSLKIWLGQIRNSTSKTPKNCIFSFLQDQLQRSSYDLFVPKDSTRSFWFTTSATVYYWALLYSLAHTNFKSWHEASLDALDLGMQAHAIFNVLIITKFSSSLITPDETYKYASSRISFVTSIRVELVVYYTERRPTNLLLSFLLD